MVWKLLSLLRNSDFSTAFVFVIYRMFKKLGAEVKRDKKWSIGRRDVPFTGKYSAWFSGVCITHTYKKKVKNFDSRGCCRRWFHGINLYYLHNAIFACKKVYMQYSVMFLFRNLALLFHWIIRNSVLCYRYFELNFCWCHIKSRITLNIYLQNENLSDP